MLSTAPPPEQKWRNNIRRIQWISWILFFIFLTFYAIQKWDPPLCGVLATVISTGFYAAAVYGNASWLIPRYYQTGRKLQYYGFSLIFVWLLVLLRVYTEYSVLVPLHQPFYGLKLPHLSFVLITNLLAFLFGALLRVAVDYVPLLRKQEEMRHRQLMTELNLLKAQVQPHFLFNTLNNIYYLAYTKNERTAEVVLKLSDIMRYFVEDAPRENVPLSTEVVFLQHYIELEQIRMLHQAQVKFTQQNTDPGMMIPPMLLIPLVENIYKHGVDKSMEVNDIEIDLRQEAGYLYFSTGNTCHHPDPAGKAGMGLTNLRKRLELIYGNDFDLHTQTTQHYFTAMLKIPVA